MGVQASGWLKTKSRQVTIWLLCLFLSVLFLLICTESSPLYPMNTWTDSNAYFTMGKGMMNGLVPYRDLFDQKGPLLFFIHGLAYLISARSFAGMFIFEVFAFSFFLFFSFKSLCLYMNERIAIMLLPALAYCILNLGSFSHGDSAEELVLPLLAFSLYALLAYFKNGSPAPSNGTYLWNGVIAGCVLWIKFSLLGFWMGWMLAILICEARERRFVQAIKGGLIFLGSMLLATLPWIVYFGANQAISDWIGTYFIINLTKYPDGVPLLQLTAMILSGLAMEVLLDPVFFFLRWTGIIAFVAFGKFIERGHQRALLAVCIFLLVLTQFGGGRIYLYYFLIFAPFVVFGMAAIVDVLRLKMKQSPAPGTVAGVIVLGMILLLPITLKFNQNTSLLGVKREALMPFKFSSITAKTPGATLFNYGKLDMGVYTAAGIVPSVKYFYQPNLEYSRFPEIKDEQNRYIREGATDYVMACIEQDSGETLADIPNLTEHYELAASSKQSIDSFEYMCYLFKKVD